MDANFWHQKWERGEIAFHESQANPLLVAHFEKLNLNKGSRVFLPLCGKTLDIGWLLANGYRVVGAELNALAISTLFQDLGLTPKITTVGTLTHFSANDIDLWLGDIFDISDRTLGPVDAVYDRAALVALPVEIRKKYASHLMKITDTAPQLLIAYEYDQQLIEGPPFSVNEDEVKQHYGDYYQLSPVERKDVEGGLKGKVASTETVWLLQKANE